MQPPQHSESLIADRLAALEAKVSETHQIVKDLRSLQRWGTALRILYWCILLGAGAVSYAVIKPYLGQFEHSIYALFPTSGEVTTEQAEQ